MLIKRRCFSVACSFILRKSMNQQCRPSSLSRLYFNSPSILFASSIGDQIQVSDTQLESLIETFPLEARIYIRQLRSSLAAKDQLLLMNDQILNLKDQNMHLKDKTISEKEKSLALRDARIYDLVSDAKLRDLRSKGDLSIRRVIEVIEFTGEFQFHRNLLRKPLQKGNRTTTLNKAYLSREEI